MRNVAKNFSDWQLERRIALLSEEFAVLTARFVMPTQRIGRELERERERGSVRVG